jgi:hypothetical protein
MVAGRMAVPCALAALMSVLTGHAYAQESTGPATAPEAAGEAAEKSLLTWATPPLC